MTEHIIYGGDARNVDELCFGDIISLDMLHEACWKVYDSKHKIMIKLPKHSARWISAETASSNQEIPIFIEPTRGWLDEIMLEIQGKRKVAIKTVISSKSFKNKYNFEYEVSLVSCGNNTCKIYTATK